MQYCKAKGYVGDTPTEAVAACSASSTPYGTETCGNDLVCYGDTFGYFRAKGYVGDTPEQAIQKCSAPSTPYGTETCSNDVKCVGST